MSSEEKTRISGEVPRPSNSPVLPTINPQAEKPQAASAGLPSFVYVA